MQHHRPNDVTVLELKKSLKTDQCYRNTRNLALRQALRSHRPLLETTDDEWNTVLATNLSSAFYLTRACLPFMVAQTWGRVINISGRDGFFPAAPNLSQ